MNRNYILGEYNWGMPENWIIRPLKTKDQPVVRELILNGLREHWGDLDPDLNPDLDDLSNSYPDSVFVAESHAEILACGALTPVNQDTWQIVRMSVDIRVRRQGLGRAILTRLIETARLRGSSRLILETTENWWEARRFYESAGFQFSYIKDGDAYYEFRLPN